MSGGEHVELWTLGAFPSVAVGVVVLRSGEAGGAAFANAVSNRACQGTSGHGSVVVLAGHARRDREVKHLC